MEDNNNTPQLNTAHYIILIYVKKLTQHTIR